MIIHPTHTATIIAFPPKGSFRRQTGQAAMVPAGPALLPVEFGSGWYHEAALKEPVLPRKS